VRVLPRATRHSGRRRSARCRFERPWPKLEIPRVAGRPYRGESALLPQMTLCHPPRLSASKQPHVNEAHTGSAEAEQ
jgi:hypothetical protein